MGLFNWLRPRSVTAAKSLTLDQVVAKYVTQESATGVVVSELSALRVSTVLACVTRVANDVATMPLKVYLQTDQGRTEARERPEYKLLHSRPNDWQTAFEFRQMMTAQAMLRGNAYAVVRRDRDGMARQLLPVRAADVSLNWDGLTATYTVSAYDGAVSGEFKRSDMLHLRRLPLDGKAGIDMLHMGRETMGLAIAAENTQARAFKNGNRMPGYWSTEAVLSDEAVDRIVGQLSNATTGKNQYRSPLLDSGMKYTSTGQTFEESQLIETRKHQMIEVCTSLGVLPAILGIDDKTQAYASVEAMFRAHLTHTLRPWLVAWEQALDRDVLDSDGPMEVKFDTSEMEKASTKERSESYRTLVELGILTRNEVRQIEGYDPIDGLDEPLTPLNVAPEGGSTDAP